MTVAVVSGSVNAALASRAPRAPVDTQPPHPSSKADTAEPQPQPQPQPQSTSTITTTSNQTQEQEQQEQQQKQGHVHVLGVIGGSSLFHAQAFAASLRETVVETEFGRVVAHVGLWRRSDLRIVFVQRHHADPDGEYKQPRQINYKAIATAMKVCGCEGVLGIYSVGSMDAQIDVGRIVIPEDYFNPFDILNMSGQYDAHVVPDVSPALRNRLLQVLQQHDIHPHDGGVYIQTAGPRFETKAEVRFFRQFGELLGMTGANEAELINELRIPFAMFGIVDNLGNGIGEQLTLEAFKVSQKINSDKMEHAVCLVLDDLAEHRFLAELPVQSSS